MENGKELILSAISAIIFCGAIILLFNQVKSYSKLLNVIQAEYTQESVMYESSYTGSDDVSYHELIASLFDTLEYDLEINGLLISKYEHTVDQIDTYIIANTAYTKSYYYDSSGMVTRIIYTTIGG